MSPVSRLTLAAVVAVLASSAPASAATINVPADQPTIQAAIDAASSGDTVAVAAGTYVEQLDVGKDITVQGAGAGSTVIEAPASMATVSGPPSYANQPILFVHAATATVDGVTLDGLGLGDANTGIAGAVFYNAGGALTHSTVTGIRQTPVGSGLWGYGVLVYDNNASVHAIDIAHDSVTDYQRGGIRILGAGLTATVDSNVVTGVGPTDQIAQNGILFRTGAAGSATNNTISGNECDRAVAGCGGDLLSNTQDFALYSDGAGAVTYSGNTLTGNDAGVLVTNSGTQTITNNTISANRYAGIFADNGTFTATGNTITGANKGIAVVTYDGESSPANGTVTGNTFSGSSDAAVWIRTQSGIDTPPTVAMHFNRFPNSGAAIDNTTLTTENAENNWFGCNAGPGQSGCSTVSGADADPWLVLHASASPSSIEAGGEPSTVTGDLNHNSDGATPASNTFPEQTLSFSTTLGSFGSASAATSGRSASSVLTSGSSTGASGATVSFDGQAASAGVTITASDATVLVDAADGTSDASGCGWASNPCNTITKGLSQATTGDTVSVASGTYGETATFGSGFAADDITLAGASASNLPVITSGIDVNNTSHAIDGLTLRNLSVKGEAPSAIGKHPIVSFFAEGAGQGAKDLTIDNLVIDGENDTTGSFGGRNAIYGMNLSGAVTIENTTIENVKGRCAFDTSCNGTSEARWPSSITIANVTVQDSNAAIALRGQNSSNRIPAVTVDHSTFTNIGPSSNSFGAAVKVFNVASLTATGNAFYDVADSGFFPGSEGGSLNFAGGLDVKNLTTMAVSQNYFDTVNEAFSVDPGGSLPGGSLTGNTFDGNTYALYIPANASTAAAPTIAENSIVGSAVQQVHNGGTGTLNVENNWWGCNGGLGASGCGSAGGSVDADPWLELALTPALSSVQPGASDAATVSMTTNSNGASIDSSLLPVLFAGLSNDGTADGAFAFGYALLIDGAGTDTWTSDGSTGTADLHATLDNETVTGSVTVAASAGDGEAAVVDGGSGGSVTTGDSTTLSSGDPVAGTAEIPAGGTGGTVSIQEVASGTVPNADQPSGSYGVAGSTFEIHAPTQTAANPLRFTFDILKSSTSALPDESVAVFRNGALVANCNPYDGTATQAIPDPCVVSRTRLDASTLEITVLSSASSFWAVGGPSPTAVLDSGPGVGLTSPYTTDATPAFDYHATDPSGAPGNSVGAFFECDVDDNTLSGGAACGDTTAAPATPASDTVAAQSDGAHTFYVQANDGFTAGPIVSQAFFVDTTDPTVAFTTTPSSLTNSGSASFVWTRSDPGGANASGLQASACELDTVSVACTTNTTKSLSGLSEGSHTFKVTVTDQAGNSANASYTWRVDTVAPTTTIDSPTPADPTNVTTADFTFEGDDTAGGNTSDPLTFECKLDAAAWTDCGAGSKASGATGTIHYGGPLSDGSHTFRVRATDHAGNTDATGDSFTWTVDTSAPTITINWPKDGGRYSIYKDVTSDWTCTDPHGVASSSSSPVDNGQALPRPGSPAANLPYTVNCTDNAGNSATRTVHYAMETFDQIVTDDAPRAYYRLDEGPGASTVTDASGNAHDGQFKNSTASEPFGISGDGDTARHFIGVGGYAFFNGIAAPQASLTLGGWVKFDDVGDADVLDHGYDAGIYVKDKRFVFRMLGTSVTDTTDIVAGQWYFVAGTWNGFQMKLWTATGTPGIHNLPAYGANVATEPKTPSGQSTLYIGYGEDEPWLRGAMDEVFYYPTALSQQHLQELWLADPPALPRPAAAPAPSTAPVNVASRPAPAKKKAHPKHKAKHHAKHRAKHHAKRRAARRHHRAARRGHR